MPRGVEITLSLICSSGFLLFGCGTIRQKASGPAVPIPSAQIRPVPMPYFLPTAADSLVDIRTLRIGDVGLAAVTVSRRVAFAQFTPEPAKEKIPVAASPPHHKSSLDLERLREYGEQLRQLLSQLDQVIRLIQQTPGPPPPTVAAPSVGLEQQAPAGIAGLLLSVLTGLLGWWQGRKQGKRQGKKNQGRS